MVRRCSRSTFKCLPSSSALRDSAEERSASASATASRRCSCASRVESANARSARCRSSALRVASRSDSLRARCSASARRRAASACSRTRFFSCSRRAASDSNPELSYRSAILLVRRRARRRAWLSSKKKGRAHDELDPSPESRPPAYSRHGPARHPRTRCSRPTPRMSSNPAAAPRASIAMLEDDHLRAPWPLDESGRSPRRITDPPTPQRGEIMGSVRRASLERRANAMTGG